MDGTFYKGVSENFLQRFEAHNAGLSAYTSHKRPWKLVYVECHQSKKSALIRERKLKKCKPAYFEWLINQPTNILLQ